MHLIVFAFGFLALTACLAEDVEEGVQEKSMEGHAKDAVEGLTDFFKSAEDNVKEKSESGFGFLKNMAGGMVGQFGTAKDKIQEHGSKIRSTLQESASNVKDEVESAVSNVSYHGEKALGFMASLLNKK